MSRTSVPADACPIGCRSRLIGHRKTADGWEEVCVCRECGDERKPTQRAPLDWFVHDHAVGRVLTCPECALSFTDSNPWSGHVLKMHCERQHGTRYVER